MVTGDDTRPKTAGDQVAVLTADHGVIWAPRPRWVTPLTPCVIDAAGVRLCRWPLWSRVIPRERVDRFEAVSEQTTDGDGEVERLVLLTRDRNTVRVQTAAIRWLGSGRRLPLHSHALHLNDHLLASAATHQPRRP